MASKINILVINAHSSLNAGDAALLEMAVQQLQRAFVNPCITLALNDPSNAITVGQMFNISSFTALVSTSDKRGTSKYNILRLLYFIVICILYAFWHHLTGCSGWHLGPQSLRAMIQAYTTADLVVSCPGNLLFTMGRIGLPFLLSAFEMAYALILGKPFYVMPQSVGPLKRRWERQVVRAIYSRARLVYAREPVSWRLLQELGLNDARYRLAPDLAFAFPCDADLLIEDWLSKWDLAANQPKVGVTVINRMVRSIDAEAWSRYQNSLALVLSRFLAHYGGKVLFFPQVIGPTPQEDDRIVAQRIMELIVPKTGVQLVDVPTSPRLLKLFYGKMDLFIATRLHSAIFSVTMGVPTLFIGYLHKTRGLVEMLGLEEWVIDLADINSEKLWEKLEALWLNRATIRHNLELIIPELEQSAIQIGEAIARDYNDYQQYQS